MSPSTKLPVLFLAHGAPPLLDDRQWLDELAAWSRALSAPRAKLALPTWEHYAPLLVAEGAAGGAGPVSFPIDGWWGNSSFTKRSVQLG